jgi:arylsulfatase A
MFSITRRSLLLSCATSAAEAARPRKLPNIVYILADDMGWGDLECFNPHSAVPTPNANALAQSGMRFTDMHSPSSVCTPTRYGILTGRYSWRSSLKKGVLNGYSPNLIEPGRLTVPALLKSRGYYTAGVGKWHLGLGGRPRTDYTLPLTPGPRAHGFDYYYGIPASLDMAPYLFFENEGVTEAATSSTPGRNDPRGVFWREGAIAPNFRMEEVLPTLAARATSIIRERAHQRQPFFLYFPMPAPHTPWVPKPEFRGRSKAGLYGDFVAQVDATVGQVMKALDETGAARDTLLILTSDNGAHWTPDDLRLFPNHRANAGWRGEKADAWDGGHRIPFLARWPGRIAAGATCDDLGCLTDLAATAAAISGATLPANAADDSFNLLGALTGKSTGPARAAVVHHSSEGMFAIRDREWKLIQGLGSGGFSAPRFEEPQPGGPRGQLYNLRDDPAESRNLYQERPEVVDRLATLLAKYQQQGFSRPR